MHNSCPGRFRSTARILATYAKSVMEKWLVSEIADDACLCLETGA